MFKHVLIPTDGSPLSKKAVKAGIGFAKEFGAKMTVYHALEVVPPFTGGGFVPPSVLEQLEASARKQARKYLDEAVRIAQASAVPCESRISKPTTAYQGIIDTAKKDKCDVIFMASHGRGGLGSLVLGSVTLKVLAHSKIPVVVFR
ncbi:MAG TPA: universal stress protein [Casimicrobiaceae bacterium]